MRLGKEHSEGLAGRLFAIMKLSKVARSGALVVTVADLNDALANSPVASIALWRKGFRGRRRVHTPTRLSIPPGSLWFPSKRCLAVAHNDSETPGEPLAALRAHHHRLDLRFDSFELDIHRAAPFATCRRAIARALEAIERTNKPPHSAIVLTLWSPSTLKKNRSAALINVQMAQKRKKPLRTEQAQLRRISASSLKGLKAAQVQEGPALKERLGIDVGHAALQGAPIQLADGGYKRLIQRITFQVRGPLAWEAPNSRQAAMAGSALRSAATTCAHQWLSSRTSLRAMSCSLSDRRRAFLSVASPQLEQVSPSPGNSTSLQEATCPAP